jgi:hypothetical protein
MTKEQVANFKQFGPYKSFQDEYLETYNGIYYGNKQNVQFLFVNNRLVKIRVYLGEQLDPHKAVPVFKRACAILENDYGKLESPEVTVPSTGGKYDADVFAAIAITNATMQGSTHVRGIRQPKDMQSLGDNYAYAQSRQKQFSGMIFFEPK